MNDVTAPISNRKTQTTNKAVDESLDAFLEAWDAVYKAELAKIELFDREKTLTYTDAQIKYFVQIFYHSRGHFKDFLWHLGNHAPNKAIKDIVLKNIEEEFSGDNPSHEQLYIDFAEKMGVDLSETIAKKAHYLSTIQEFNEGHVRWLSEHTWESQFAAFSAYERLDETDYEALTGLFPEEHIFFEIHRKATHFDKTYEPLLKIWSQNSSIVSTAFEFIKTTQLKMWKDLSDAISTV